MSIRTSGRWSVVLLAILLTLGVALPREARADSSLDDAVIQALAAQGFTGRIESQIEARLGRQVDRALADLGRNLWFDNLGSLNGDNTCGGCHSPLTGFGDTQSIAIGIDNNNIVGPSREGPRNQRRTPMAANTALYPRLMWNGRFAALSGDPFDNSAGFSFPPPEGLSLSGRSHLLVAQAFIPPTERVEAAGFDFVGTNDDIRAEVVKRLNDTPAYVERFGELFPEVAAGGLINYDMFAQATAEFEFTLVFANAPVDKFARGHREAMTDSQKRGALLFFGKAKCVSCHSVSGDSNEMFSDFDNHVIGVPQIVPSDTNVVFDGPGSNEDFGLEQVTGDPADRYKFRSAPLRNLAVVPAFMHNGAFVSLEGAIQHHLDIPASVASYSTAQLDLDLQNPLAPMADVLARVDPILASPIQLTSGEFADLVEFVRNGLTDERIKQTNLERLIPASVPSGLPLPIFEAACSSDSQCGIHEFCGGAGCAAKSANGESCSIDVECDSGLCAAGACATPAGVTCVEIVRGGAGSVADAFLSGDAPKAKGGSAATSSTGECDSGNAEDYTLVRFDLGKIPANATIKSAVARVHFAFNDSAMEVASHPVLASWNEKSASHHTFVKPGAWDDMPFTQTFAGGDGYKDFDLTALVADWASGALQNRGILLREPKFDAHDVHTSESSAATRPRLMVCYQ